MNEILISFEKATGLGPTFAAKLIGIAYVTYAQYRNGSRPLQKYHAQHIEAILLLPERALRQLIDKHCYGKANTQRR